MHSKWNYRIINGIIVLGNIMSSFGCALPTSTILICVYIQIPLEPHVKKEIIMELRSPDHLRRNLDVVEIVLGFLSSGGGKADRSLGEYVERTLKMKGRFCEKVGSVELLS